MTAMTSLFDRLNKRQLGNDPPKPERTIPRGPLLQPIVPPTNRGSSPSEQLLDFVVNRWPKPAVRARDIMRYGPPAARNRKSAIALAEDLATHGCSPHFHQHASITKNCGRSFEDQAGKPFELISHA